MEITQTSSPQEGAMDITLNGKPIRFYNGETVTRYIVAFLLGGYADQPRAVAVAGIRPR